MDDLKETAIASAAAWASTMRGRPSHFQETVTGVSSEELSYGRVISRRRRRSLVWISEPDKSRKKPQDAPVAEADLDPWSLTPDELELRSRHTGVCDQCEGHKRVACRACQATGRQPCAHCRGSGKTTAYRKQGPKTINCKTCRGRGDRKCEQCKGGRVGCPTCAGVGKIVRWIKSEETLESFIGTFPDSALVGHHPSIRTDSEAASQWSGAELVETVRVAGSLADDQIPHSARRAGFVRVPMDFDPRTDRVESEVMELYRAPAARVVFDFAGCKGHVQMFGRGLEPVSHDTGPFASMTKWRGTVRKITFAATLIGFGWFVLRDQYYRTASSLWVLGGLALAATLIELAVMDARSRSRFEVQRRPGSRWQHLRWLGVVVSLALVAGTWVSTGPSAEAVVELSASERLSEAETELAALRRIAGDNPAFRSAQSSFRQAQEKAVLAEIRAMIGAGRSAGALYRLEELQLHSKAADAARVDALLNMAKSCQDPICRLENLKKAATIERGATLVAEMSETLERTLQKWGDRISSKHAGAKGVASTAEVLVGLESAVALFPENEQAVVLRDRARTLFHKRARANHLLGARVNEAAAISSAELVEASKNVHAIRGVDIPGASLFAIGERRIRAVYISALNRQTGAIDVERLNILFPLIAGAPPPDGWFVAEHRIGVVHKTKRLDRKKRVELGWKDGRLVEVTVGRIL